MIFKDLKKRISLEATKAQQQFRLSDILKDRPFWIWNIEEHKLQDIRTNRHCCFNHIIGLPTKEREKKAIFDYEKILYDVLLDNGYSNPLKHTFKHKHLWVKKATGLGVTEFFLIDGMALYEV